MSDVEPMPELNTEFNAEQEAFFRGTAAGKLLLSRCLDTGKCFYYPRERSPFTGGKTEWVTASGYGVIYSCSVLYRADPPYCIAYVQLDEGPLILTNILSEDVNSIAIGQRVQVVFQQANNGKTVPFFTPVN